MFGLLCGAYAQNAADRTLPPIMSMVQKTDLETARATFEASSLYSSTILIVAMFIGAAAAGFLARRKGILTGVLSNSPYTLGVAYVLFVSVAAGHYDALSRLPGASEVTGDSSLQFQLLLRLVLFILAASIGGLLGQKLYAPEIDPDLDQERVTVFGVRWAHYIWILPFIYLGFLASAIIIAYAGFVVILVEFSFLWHPSLWFLSPIYWIFPVGPILVWLAMWITLISFVRFYEAMQYRQTRFKVWKKVGRVLWYGVGGPALSYTLAALGADAAHAMPKPVAGDWKIAVGLVAAVILIGSISSLISGIGKRRYRSRRPHESASATLRIEHVPFVA